MSTCFITDCHKRLRDVVRNFAETEIRPHVAEMEEARSVQHHIPRRMALHGWMGATIDRKYGGMDIGHVGKTIIIEEISRISGAMGAAVQASQLGVAKIIHFGNERQKSRWLPAVAAGHCLPTIAVTESDSGGHILGMTASAIRDGDHYVLNGRKVLVGNSHIGDLHGVVVRTGDGSNGLSAFLVESDREGVTLETFKPALGLHGFSFGELIFSNCRVPADNRLGREGDGMAVAYSSSILYGRANLAAVALGIHRALVEETTAFTLRQRRYGSPLCELPTIQQKLGAMQSQLMAAELSLYHAAYLLDQGSPCDADLVNAKLTNVEYALDSARIAMEIHAGCGLFASSPIERNLRDVHHIFAPAGTSDIQRLRLAEVALGRSKGDWSQRFAVKPRDGHPTRPRSDQECAVRRPLRPTKSGNKRILLVDDDATFRLIMRYIVGRQGTYEVIEAEDGGSAMELARRHAPDVIILDLKMPNMDGFAFLQEFVRDERIRLIPVIVSTGALLGPELEARLPAGTQILSKNVIARDNASACLDNAIRAARPLPAQISIC